MFRDRYAQRSRSTLTLFSGRSGFGPWPAAKIRSMQLVPNWSGETEGAPGVCRARFCVALNNSSCWYCAGVLKNPGNLLVLGSRSLATCLIASVRSAEGPRYGLIPPRLEMLKDRIAAAEAQGACPSDALAGHQLVINMLLTCGNTNSAPA